MMIKRVVFVGAMLVLVTSIIVWLTYKPVRVFWPSMNGVLCINERICIENGAEIGEAESLYSEASEYVQSQLGQFDEYPRFIFCETQSCFESFGFSRASAQSLGTVATVVGPKGWKGYVAEHEMIHHVQNERLGSIRFISLPQWFVEGMAYSMSRDPREILKEP